MKKITSAFIALAIVASPLLASADTTSSQVQAMLAQIQALQTQIQALRTAQSQVASTSANIGNTLNIMRDLRQGMSGDDVKALQAILASDPTIYQGAITGFYGSLTKEAVKKFQKKYGLPILGTVSSSTIKKLHDERDSLGLKKEDDKLCIKIAPGHEIAKGWLKKEKEDKGKGKGDEKKRKDTPGTISIENLILPLCKDLPKGIEDKDRDWNHGSTTKDTVAPVLSAISTPDIKATSTKITWTTNENSNSKVWFGTSTPVNPGLSANITNLDLVTNHIVALPNLATSTTYYYVVGSSDASGNLATSSQGSFVTLVQ